MPQKYLKPVKKYLSRKLALEKLKLSSKQFDRMCVLSNIYPVIAPLKNCVDGEKGWFYKIDDIKAIYYSDAYDVVKKNKGVENKRKKYLKFNKTDKLARLKEEEYGYVNLIKYKYKDFGSALLDLGDSLKTLYFIKMLNTDEVSDALNEFEEFLIQRRLLDKAFMSKKGVYYSFNCEQIRVVWQIPYEGLDCSNLIEEKKELEIKLKGTNITFLDFGSELDDVAESSDEVIDPNDPDKLDISLLKYSAPLLVAHLRLVLHKLKIIYNDPSPGRDGLFKNRKIHIAIKSIPKHIELILKNEEAILVDPEDAEIVITETVDKIIPGVIYIQPQFIFDSLNKDHVLDFQPYLVGKPLPPHVSPFPDIVDMLDERMLKTLSNTRKYKILDKVEKLN